MAKAPRPIDDYSICEHICFVVGPFVLMTVIGYLIMGRGA
jgi:hypothetical protein